MRAQCPTWSRGSKTCTWLFFRARSVWRGLPVKLEVSPRMQESASLLPRLQHLSFPRSTARWWTSSTTARTAPRTTSADCSRPNNITWKSSKNAMTKVEKFIDRLWTEISKLPKFLAGLETYRNRTNQKIWSTEFSSGSHRVCEIHICYLWLQYIFILFIKTKNQPS